MDYDVLNEVIGEINNIVYDYCRKNNYGFEHTKTLIRVLFGYYLAMGEEVFAKINNVFDVLEMDYCQDFDDYREAYEKHDSILPAFLEETPYPLLKWNYQFDQDKMFKGAFPQIIYIGSKDEVREVLTIGHELMHALDGVSAVYLGENDEIVKLSMGFSSNLVDKRTKNCTIENRGMSEMAAIAVAHKMLREFLKIDPDKIDSALVRDFLSKLQQYKKHGTVVDSYGGLSVVLKDLFDNDAFFELVKKYYMENDEESFKEAFESVDEELSYLKLKNCIWGIIRNNCDTNSIFYYGNILNQQVDKFSKGTKFEPEKRLLLVV